MRSIFFCCLALTALAACDDGARPVDTDVQGDTSPAADRDADGIPDATDNCPDAVNADQLDTDLDGLGDACDADKDGDGFALAVDCDDDNPDVHLPTPFYADTDADTLGDPLEWVLACGAPVDHVGNDDDREPECATNDTDECDVCAGPGPATWYPDGDGDGLGDESLPVTMCKRPAGFIDNSDDPDPECADGGRDDCGVCEGDNRNKDCAGVCFGPSKFDDCGVCDGPGKLLFYADVDGDLLGDPSRAAIDCRQPADHVTNADDLEPACTTNDTDDCGVCAGTNADKDCAGICSGEAFLDGCEVCVGGVTGREPSTRDGDRDGRPDACDLCTNEQLGRTVIQWTHVSPYAPGGGPYTFQLILWTNGEWAYLYEGVEPYAATATVGWQGPAGIPAIELAYNSDYVRDHPRVFFRPDEAGVPLLDYAVPIEWIDIRGTGTRLAMGDDTVRPVALPVPFPFAGTSYPTVHVSANGFVSFSGVDAGYRNQHLPFATAGAMMAILWDDLNPLQGGTVWVRHFPAGCEADCHGDFGGAALVDDCGMCVYGRTEDVSEDFTDCNDDCLGEAEIDSCGACAGGLTGVVPAPEDACDRFPDLIVGQQTLRNSLFVAYVDIGADACLVNEGCVGGVGVRRVIRFSTLIANIGTADLTLGRPGPQAPWVYDTCHGHYHFNAYAQYRVYDVTNGVLLPIGAKTGFCVMDTQVYDARLAPNGCRGYNCMNQGITVGCGDIYSSSLQCQWVDVTGVPDGIYDITVTTNPDGEIDELNLDNNSATVRIEMVGDTLTVLD